MSAHKGSSMASSLGMHAHVDLTACFASLGPSQHALSLYQVRTLSRDGTYSKRVVRGLEKQSMQSGQHVHACQGLKPCCFLCVLTYHGSSFTAAFATSHLLQLFLQAGHSGDIEHDHSQSCINVHRT